MRPSTATRRPRPQWRRLYAIASVGVALVALSELAVTTPALRLALDCAASVATWSAMLIWIWVNRVALDQLEWGDPQAMTVTVRVIDARPASPVSCPAGPLVAAGGHPSSFELEAREPSAVASS